MNARDAILAAVGGASRPGADIAREAAALLDRVPGLRPDRVTGDPAEAFLARVTGPAIGATATRVAALADVPDAVRAYLDAHGLPASVALQPHPKLEALDWSGLDIHSAIAVDEAASVLIAPYAVAETGSLVFRSGPDMPVLFAFLPLHCLVVVEASERRRVARGLRRDRGEAPGAAQSQPDHRRVGHHRHRRRAGPRRAWPRQPARHFRRALQPPTVEPRACSSNY